MLHHNYPLTFRYRAKWLAALVLFTGVFVVSCASFPISSSDELCTIFSAKKGWHSTALKMQDKWQVPLHVPMAIMYHESKFRHNAKPPRRYLLGFIPWKRRSTAYGYAQAVNGTWENYVTSTNSRGARRTRFEDALDFMGWYLDKTSRINSIAKDDAYRQYLAYHEGWTGYQRRSYEKKPWLIEVASNVDALAARYESQYRGCADDLPRGFWQRLLPG